MHLLNTMDSECWATSPTCCSTPPRGLIPPFSKHYLAHGGVWYVLIENNYEELALTKTGMVSLSPGLRVSLYKAASYTLAFL